MPNIGLPNTTNIWARVAGAKGKIIAGIVLIIILAIGAAAIYYVAYNKGENVSKVELKDYERRVQELNARQLEREAKVTERVIREYHTRTIERERVIYQNRDTIRDQVPDRNTVLSSGWIYAHNRAAAGQIIDPERAAETSPSGTTAVDALEVIASNYNIANQEADRADALRDWIRSTQRESRSDQATTNSN